ncbi:hypothetical protein [Streptomyces sp. KLOTTS4A1]|uniref:hypothetical protein n=1 Tax=Streptomyces sp. KLOTTS4A1 TaxID=3390996 RepID=UPI0039F5004A
MTQFEKANGTEISERENLADGVARALTMAGLTAIAREADHDPHTGGALILVDPGADTQGGVFVQWEVHPSLSRAASAGAARGENQSPAFLYFSSIIPQMQTVLIAILGAAGFRATDANDDMSPYTIRVEGA